MLLFSQYRQTYHVEIDSLRTFYILSTTINPDDFIDSFENFPNAELMLERAPEVWTINKIDPNILVSVSDAKFDLSYENKYTS